MRLEFCSGDVHRRSATDQAQMNSSFLIAMRNRSLLIATMKNRAQSIINYNNEHKFVTSDRIAFVRIRERLREFMDVSCSLHSHEDSRAIFLNFSE